MITDRAVRLKKIIILENEKELYIKNMNKKH